MKKSLLTLALAATLSAPAFAADQYLVRVPANVNLSAAAPETPQEPISLSLSAEALPAATVNEPYSFNLLDRLTITGGSGSHNYSDTAWSLKAGDALPPGLSLSGSMIAGTPTVKNEAGTSFEVTGTYQDASGKQVYTIVVGGQTLKVTQISTGNDHTCAVTASGAAMCWGMNGYGQIGDGTLETRYRPTPVEGLDSGVKSISAGTVTTCAVMTSGSAKCWGRGAHGQLGDNRSTSSAIPVDVEDMTEISSISVGGLHVCALNNSGAAKCWGYNAHGQLGDGSETTQASPVPVSGLQSGVTQISAANTHTCAVHNGAAKCWGANGNGKVGDGTLKNRSTPVNVSGLLSGVTRISAWWSHTCAIQNGAVKCWGDNTKGQHGNGTKTTSNVTVPSASSITEGAIDIGTGTEFSCVLTSQGQIKCFGMNAGGGLGNGSITNSAMPVLVGGLEGGANQLTVGTSRACARMNAGEAKCWGSGSPIGNGNLTQSTTPIEVLR